MVFFYYTEVLRYLYLGPASAMYNEMCAWSQSILTALQGLPLTVFLSS